MGLKQPTLHVEAAYRTAGGPLKSESQNSPTQFRSLQTYFHASRHISGYQRPSSISMSSKSVMTLPSSFGPYWRIMSGIEVSECSKCPTRPRLFAQIRAADKTGLTGCPATPRGAPASDGRLIGQEGGG